MTNKKTTKRALFMSLMAMLLCFTMLLGTTYAWFTDSATVSGNKIQSGTLDIALEMWDGTKWVDAEGKTLNFISANGETDILWEPGCNYQLPKLRVVNKGNLAAKFQVQVTGIAGDAKLNEAIDWFFSYEAGSSMQRLKWKAFSSLNQSLVVAPVGGTWGMNDDKLEFQFDGKMKTSAGNEYQGLTIEGVSITVVATQATYEYDSKDDQYDVNAEYPNVTVVSSADKLAELTDSTDKDLAVDLTSNLTLGNSTDKCDALVFANTESLTIDGNGKVLTLSGKALYGDNSDNTLSGIIAENAIVTVKNMTIVNEKLSNKGTETSADRAAVYTMIRGEKVIYENVNFVGGVQVKGNETFINCTFTEDCVITDTEGYATDGKFCMFIDHQYDATGEYTVNLEGCIFNASGYGCVKVAGDGGAKITVNVKDCSFTNTCPSNSWDKTTPKYDIKTTPKDVANSNITVNDLGGNTWSSGANSGIGNG